MLLEFLSIRSRQQQAQFKENTEASVVCDGRPLITTVLDGGLSSLRDLLAPESPYWSFPPKIWVVTVLFLQKERDTLCSTQR
jgi:hypothetical protein